MKAGVVKIPDSTQDTPESSHQQQDLPLFWKFDTFHEANFQDTCQCIDWHPSRAGRIATIYSSKFFVWDIENDKPSVVTSQDSSSADLYMGKWNPHLDGNQLATVASTAVTGFDLRCKGETWNIPLAHKFQVRDVDFNPNKQYFMATCGDDCAVRFWDVRSSKEHVKEVKAHSHWVWRVRYNPFHDQLLLTAGSDSRVLLHGISTISSESKTDKDLSIEGEDKEEIPSTP